MGKKIGIKLADGSFYPIMEDGVPQKKTDGINHCSGQSDRGIH